MAEKLSFTARAPRGPADSPTTIFRICQDLLFMQVKILEILDRLSASDALPLADREAIAGVRQQILDRLESVLDDLHERLGDNDG